MDNRRIDVLVAQYVMGWKLFHDYQPEKIISFKTDEGKIVYIGVTDTDSYKWHPSTDIQAAWQVKNKITENNEWGFSLFNDGNGLTEVEFRHGNNKYWAEDDTDELAICKAALKAVGIEIDETEQHYTEQSKGE